MKLTPAKLKRAQARLAVFVAKFPCVAEAAAGEFGFRPEELFAGAGVHPSHSLSHTRAVALWLAYQSGETTFVALAEMFGIGYPACRARVKVVAERRGRQVKFRALLDRLCDAVGISP